MFTIDYIKKDMGFSLPFIRKCLKELDSILKPHYKRGDSNQIMFTENGYAILDQIKQLKEQGLNIKAIKEHLDKQLKQDDKGDQEDIPCDQHTDINLLKKLFAEKELRLKERLEHQQRIFELEHVSQYQQRINELENLSDHLKSQLLYITDGKSPDEYKNVWYQEQMEKQQLKTTSEQLKEQLSNITDGKPVEEFKNNYSRSNLIKPV
jgi:DNA-binding transcriptional MerR regulator